jgi:hypothetical protein
MVVTENSIYLSIVILIYIPYGIFVNMGEIQNEGVRFTFSDLNWEAPEDLQGKWGYNMRIRRKTPDNNGFEAILNIRIDPNVLSIDQLTESELAKARKGDASFSKVSEGPAAFMPTSTPGEQFDSRKIVFTKTNPKFGPIKVQLIALVAHNRGIIMNYEALESNFDLYLNEANTILYSLQFI